MTAGQPDLFADDLYRWPPRAGVTHPGRTREGDRCTCPPCGRRNLTAWINAGRPTHETSTP